MARSANHELLNEADFARLFLEDIPLLDVRAPVEFRHGAFPCATNIPLLEDDEREQVGKVYKQAGRDAALALGHRLVSGSTKDQRLANWSDFYHRHPNAALYCFRGGQRSKIAQQWLAEAGISIPRVAGGYKSMRRFLINSIAFPVANTPLLILGGKTGSGKTRLLVSFANSLDLEALARHRGSAFGPRVAAQPGQIDFENQLAIALLKLQQNPLPRVLLEDESRAIGSLSLPLQLHNRMRASPLAVIEEPVNYRAGIILNDYIRINFLEFRQTSPTDHHELFASYLTGSLGKIRKRLGGQLYSRIEQDMQDAISAHRQTDNLHVHQRWIETLLQTYYDPMYEYQLGKKLDHIVFRGNSKEFLAWAGHFNPLRAVNRSL